MGGPALPDWRFHNANECPECDSREQRIVETRTTEYNTPRRRHECKACGHRWYSVELNEEQLYRLMKSWQS